jgi:uncharacterized protein (TIGR03435 family)
MAQNWQPRLDFQAILPLCLAAPLVALAMNSFVLWAQTAASGRPMFEVASIRPSKECGGGGLKGAGKGGGTGPRGLSRSPGKLEFRCVTVAALIRQAYSAFASGRMTSAWAIAQPVEGGPSWINSDRYTISAKAEDNTKPGVMSGPMLQTLLENRFKLKIHRETRTVPEYALTIAKNGPKLERFSEERCTPIDRDSSSPVPLPPIQKPLCKSLIRMKGANLATIEMQATTLDDFSKALGRILERPVVDKTGITGMFDVRLEFALDDASGGFLPPNSPAPLIPDDFSGPSIFTAVQEQLGLKLDSTKGPIEFLVVDHAERPSAN